MDSIPKYEIETIRRLLPAHELCSLVKTQGNRIDSYDRPLGIRGFVSYGHHPREISLFDESLIGISRTDIGKIINNLAPLALHQMDLHKAGFVPEGLPLYEGLTRKLIENGIAKEEPVFCVDHRSLWDLRGGGIYAQNICPRDGSGYAPAKFATDGESIIGISHGNHPYYSLDIIKIDKNKNQENIKSIRLNPDKIPFKLIAHCGDILSCDGHNIQNHGQDRVLFQSPEGYISSATDSGLCTVQTKKRTEFYDFFKNELVQAIDGEHVFLERTPQ